MNKQLLFLCAVLCAVNVAASDGAASPGGRRPSGVVQVQCKWQPTSRSGKTPKRNKKAIQTAAKERVKAGLCPDTNDRDLSWTGAEAGFNELVGQLRREIVDRGTAQVQLDALRSGSESKSGESETVDARGIVLQSVMDKRIKELQESHKLAVAAAVTKALQEREADHEVTVDAYETELATLRAASDSSLAQREMSGLSASAADAISREHVSSLQQRVRALVLARYETDGPALGDDELPDAIERLVQDREAERDRLLSVNRDLVAASHSLAGDTNRAQDDEAASRDHYHGKMSVLVGMLAGGAVAISKVLK